MSCLRRGGPKRPERQAALPPGRWKARQENGSTGPCVRCREGGRTDQESYVNLNPTAQEAARTVNGYAARSS